MIYAQYDYTNQVSIRPCDDLDIVSETHLSLYEIMNVSLSNNFISENHEKRCQEIQQKLDIMKQQALEKNTLSNTTHYFITYTSIIGLVLSIFGILGCYIKSKRCVTCNNECPRYKVLHVHQQGRWIERHSVTL